MVGSTDGMFGQFRGRKGSGAPCCLIGCTKWILTRAAFNEQQTGAQFRRTVPDSKAATLLAAIETQHIHGIFTVIGTVSSIHTVYITWLAHLVLYRAAGDCTGCGWPGEQRSRGSGVPYHHCVLRVHMRNYCRVMVCVHVHANCVLEFTII